MRLTKAIPYLHVQACEPRLTICYGALEQPIQAYEPCWSDVLAFIVGNIFLRWAMTRPGAQEREHQYIWKKEKKFISIKRNAAELFDIPKLGLSKNLTDSIVSCLVFQIDQESMSFTNNSRNLVVPFQQPSIDTTKTII